MNEGLFRGLWSQAVGLTGPARGEEIPFRITGNNMYQFLMTAASRWDMRKTSAEGMPVSPLRWLETGDRWIVVPIAPAFASAFAPAQMALQLQGDIGEILNEVMGESRPGIGTWFIGDAGLVP